MSSEAQRDTGGRADPSPGRATVPTARPSRRRFWIRRVHSATGVLPLSVFVVAHLAVQSSVLGGPDAHAEAMARHGWVDASSWFVIALVLVPLAVHAAIGLSIALRARSELSAYPGGAHWRYVLQRVTGLLSLVYLVVHLGETWLPRLRGELDGADTYAVLVESLSTTTSGGAPYRAVFELVGLAAICFHLASGLWGFLCSWGLTVSRRAQRRAAVVLGLFGVALFLHAANLAFHLSTGARLVHQVPSIERLPSRVFAEARR